MCCHNVSPFLFCLCEYSGKNFIFLFLIRNKKTVVLKVHPTQYPIPDSALQQSPREKHDKRKSPKSPFSNRIIVMFSRSCCPSLIQVCLLHSLLDFTSLHALNHFLNPVELTCELSSK